MSLGRSHHAGCARVGKVAYSRRRGELRGRPCNPHTHRVGGPRKLHCDRRNCGCSQPSTNKQNVSAEWLRARNRDTHSGLVGETIARGHGQMPCRTVGVVLELVGVQVSARRGGAIGIAGDMRRVHHGLMMLIPKGIWSAHCQSVCLSVGRCFQSTGNPIARLR